MNHVFNSKMIDVNKNCFNLIRLIAAIQVLFGHAVIHFNLDMGGDFMQYGYHLGECLFFLF